MKNLHNNKVGSRWQNLHNNKIGFQWKNLHNNNKIGSQWKKNLHNYKIDFQQEKKNHNNNNNNNNTYLIFQPAFFFSFFFLGFRNLNETKSCVFFFLIVIGCVHTYTPWSTYTPHTHILHTLAELAEEHGFVCQKGERQTNSRLLLWATTTFLQMVQ